MRILCWLVLVLLTVFSLCPSAEARGRRSEGGCNSCGPAGCAAPAPETSNPCGPGKVCTPPVVTYEKHVEKTITRTTDAVREVIERTGGPLERIRTWWQNRRQTAVERRDERPHPIRNWIANRRNR
jgi:hypothetical protein